MMHEDGGFFSHWGFGFGHWSLGILFWVVVFALLFLIARAANKK